MHSVDQILIKDYNDIPLKGPTSLAFNKEDNVIYFTDAGNFLNVSVYPSNCSLFMIDLDTKILRPILYNSLSYPSDVIYEPKNGYIYVAETLANRIIRITQNPGGVYNSSVFYQFNGRVGPTAMAIDDSGNLYVARYEFQLGLDGNDFDGIISILNKNGRMIGELILPNLSEITGLLISSKKREILYMTEKNSSHIYGIKLSAFLSEIDKIEEMNKVFNYQ
jgi:sugar lactone lactonase YvrE